jgi:hypothetical protein
MSELDRPSAGSPPSRRGGGGSLEKRQINDRGAMYRIAYEESQRALDDELDELKGMRDRAVNFMAFIGAATAFLVGTGLSSSNKDTAFYTIAGIASGLFAVVIVLLFFLLGPSRRRPWYNKISAGAIITEWIETDFPPNEAQLMRALAEKNDDSRIQNEKVLGSLRSRYQLIIAGGAFQLVLWAILVWVKG